MAIRIERVSSARLEIKSLSCGVGDGYHNCGVIDDVSIGSIPLGQGLDDQPWSVKDRVLVRPNTGNLIMGDSQHELLCPNVHC